MSKIVVIEDDDQFRAYLVAMLSELNHVIFAAENGMTGLDLVIAENPDIVITDIIMPEMEGVEVVLKIRNFNKDLPIIAISGGNLGNPTSYLNMAKKLGANEVLEKPFTRNELITKLDSLLSLK